MIAFEGKCGPLFIDNWINKAKIFLSYEILYINNNVSSCMLYCTSYACLGNARIPFHRELSLYDFL